MKTNVAKERITELGAAEKLYQFRSEQEHFIGDSFEPIIAYGKHAAIVHYSATEETDIPLEARGMVLNDRRDFISMFKKSIEDLNKLG